MNFKLTRPAWMEVNLDLLEHNVKQIQANISPNTKILAIVKSDAYEMGAKPIVHKLKRLGIDDFGVATLSEALSIRQCFSDINILVLGYTPNYLMEETIQNNISATVYSLDSAKEFNEYAKSLHQKAHIHLAIDTGMRRIGFIPSEESKREILSISSLSHIVIDGAFSHFASSDHDDAFSEKQFQEFLHFTEDLKKAGVSIPLRHISNSHGILKWRKYDLDMVRPGIILYGSYDGLTGYDYDLKFIGAIKAQIAHIKTIPPNETVSYGRNYTTVRDTKIVTLPLGYTDGFPRMLSGKLQVLINGVKCPQIGNICMDQMMVDATGVDCQVGDEVVLIGRQKNNEILLSDLASQTQDIDTSYLTHFNKRLPIVYIEDNDYVLIEDKMKKI
ncbi:MAG: alanine racemase [Tissierellia bacterium]|nr:alanine racemase [Tissierellia bacterium]